jgi:hypothetical protein
MTGDPIAQGLVVRVERGLCPRNLFRGEARKGGPPPFEFPRNLSEKHVQPSQGAHRWMFRFRAPAPPAQPTLGEAEGGGFELGPSRPASMA